MNQRSKIGPTADEKKDWRCNSSEYNNRYHVFSLCEQGNAKPAAIKKSDNRDTFRTGDEMFNKSSYMYDYAEKPSTAPIRIKTKKGPSSIAPDSGATMDCVSSYKHSFNKKDAKPAQSVRPPTPQGLGWQNNNELKLSSVSMRCYRPYTADEVQQSQRHPIIISPEYGAIDTNPETRPDMAFQTTVQKNFVKHDGCFRPPPAGGAIKTPANGIAGIAGADVNAKMDLTTTHRSTFQPKTTAMELVAVPPLIKDKSAKKPGWYKSIDSNGEGNISTQMCDYIVHNGVRRPASFKPLLQYNKPETKFHTNTLYKNAFTVHGNQRRNPMIPAARTKDDEIIKHVISKDALYDTEYHRIYKQAPAQFSRPKAIVPKTTQRTGGRFYDCTSYSTNYNCDSERNVARIPSFRPKKISDPWYKSNDTESQFRSTTRDHYTGAFAKPANICRPKIKKDQGIGNVTREVHFDTEYSNCFAAVPATV